MTRAASKKRCAKPSLKSTAPSCKGRPCKSTVATGVCAKVDKSTKSKCCKSRSSRHSSTALVMWRRAVVEEGYMKAGADFKPLPKKNTAGYKAIHARYVKLMKQQ